MTTRRNLKTILVSCSATAAIIAATCSARAADMPVRAAPPVVGTFDFFTGIEAHVQGEAGLLANPDNPANGPNGSNYNFGDLYTDHANTPQLNQILMTVTKPIDPKATGYAFGFTGQALYGTDMRSNHFLGIAAFSQSDRAQLNVTQAFVAAHLPWFTGGGVDVKAGLFTSPQGFETLDPSTSTFYSHAMTYYYNVTFNHTGVLTTTHVNDTVDLWLGIDTGNQTSFGRLGDPNDVPAGFVGFGLNHLLNDKLTVLALSHIGPEQSRYVTAFANKDIRYYNDAVFTYKINDAWTAVTELNYLREERTGVGPAQAYSGFTTLSYGFAPGYTLNFRGEVYRDQNNYFVSTPTDNLGIPKVELGAPPLGTAPVPAFVGTPSILFAGSPTTYSNFTLGLTYKPDVPKPFALVAIRPEIRYSKILAGANSYGASAASGFTDGKDHQFTFGGDIIIGF